jgi:hypothetical protein
MFTGVEDYLVPGRECGECTACCTHLHIDEPELQKPGGVTCGNCRENAGCTIYATRPKVCRTWFCCWRIMAEFDDSWRPDKSNILITLETANIPPEYVSVVRCASTSSVLWPWCLSHVFSLSLRW